MSERARILAKKPEAKREASVSRTRKTDLSQSMKSPADRILFLQRTIGNQAVQRMVRSGALQAKLAIGKPGDIYEQEADRVADAVMQMPEPQVRRQVEPEEEEEETLQSKPLASQITPLVQVQRQEEPEEEEETLQAKPLAEEITPLVQRQVEPEEEKEELQAKATSSRISEVNPNIESQIQSLKGGGQPLSENDRAFFEPRFGHDFSQVRVHTESSAADTAKSINARAFTLGNHVAMGSGEYHPNSRSGQRLLGHELTHVIQQGEGRTSSKAQHRESIESDPIDARMPDPKIDGAVVGNQKSVRNELSSLRIGKNVQLNPDKKRRMPHPLEGLHEAFKEHAKYIKKKGRLHPQDLTEKDIEYAIVYNNTRFNQYFKKKGQKQYTTRDIIQWTVGTPATGAFNESTIKNLAEWQWKKGLDASGKVDDDTLEKLVMHELGMRPKYKDRLYAIYLMLDGNDIGHKYISAWDYDWKANNLYYVERHATVYGYHVFLARQAFASYKRLHYAIMSAIGQVEKLGRPKKKQKGPGRWEPKPPPIYRGKLSRNQFLQLLEANWSKVPTGYNRRDAAKYPSYKVYYKGHIVSENSKEKISEIKKHCEAWWGYGFSANAKEVKRYSKQYRFTTLGKAWVKFGCFHIKKGKWLSKPHPVSEVDYLKLLNLLRPNQSKCPTQSDMDKGGIHIMDKDELIEVIHKRRLIGAAWNEPLLQAEWKDYVSWSKDVRLPDLLEELKKYRYIGMYYGQRNYRDRYRREYSFPLCCVSIRDSKRRVRISVDSYYRMIDKIKKELKFYRAIKNRGRNLNTALKQIRKNYKSILKRREVKIMIKIYLGEITGPKNWDIYLSKSKVEALRHKMARNWTRYDREANRASKDIKEVLQGLYKGVSDLDVAKRIRTVFKEAEDGIWYLYRRKNESYPKEDPESHSMYEWAKKRGDRRNTLLHLIFKGK